MMTAKSRMDAARILYFCTSLFRPLNGVSKELTPLGYLKGMVTECAISHPRLRIPGRARFRRQLKYHEVLKAANDRKSVLTSTAL
jgi:hypothetical protein